MFTESMIHLFEKGAITNRKKSLWPGSLLRLLHSAQRKCILSLRDNPGVLLLRGSYVNDPYVVAQNENMVSINTAICRSHGAGMFRKQLELGTIAVPEDN